MKWKKTRDSLQGWRELMRQRNNHQNCMNVVSLLVCNYLTFLSKANEGGGNDFKPGVFMSFTSTWTDITQILRSHFHHVSYSRITILSKCCKILRRLFCVFAGSAVCVWADVWQCREVQGTKKGFIFNFAIVPWRMRLLWACSLGAREVVLSGNMCTLGTVRGVAASFVQTVSSSLMVNAWNTDFKAQVVCSDLGNTCVYLGFLQRISTPVWEHAAWQVRTPCPVALRYASLCGTLANELRPTPDLVPQDGLRSFCSVDPLQFSSTGLRETLVLHCNSVWVQRNGEEEGTLGQTVLSAGVSPRPGPRQQTMPTFCACPIDSGCRGTLPWFSSMGTLRARGISLMARQELLWLQTLGQRAENKRYNEWKLATYTSAEMRRKGVGVPSGGADGKRDRDRTDH